MTRGASTRPVRRLQDWDEEALYQLARQYETPLYVYDLDRVEANYRRLNDVFPQATIAYAAKANTSNAVLERLVEIGASVECASFGEVVRALDAGFDPTDVLYTAVNPPAADLDGICDLEVASELTVTVGASDTVDRLADRTYPGSVCLRITPGIGAGHHEKVTTGADPKFGVPPNHANELARSIVDTGMELVGVHAHAGSGIDTDDFEAYFEMVARVTSVASSLEADGIELSFVDVGGGLPVPYRLEESPLDLEAFAEGLKDRFDEQWTLQLEPGRYLVADAGVLLTTVNTVKRYDETIVGVDAGMTTLIRPAMYGAYHDIGSIEPDRKTRTNETVTITGPICESGDVLGEDRSISSPVVGDVLAIATTGAYGFEMASHYNSRPRPACVVISDDRVALTRRRESIEDLTIHEQGVPWDDD